MTAATLRCLVRPSVPALAIILACVAVILVAATHGRPTSPSVAEVPEAGTVLLKPGSGPWIEARRTVRQPDCDDLAA
jgi:hypothetical protein